jgi:hypothetical protein
MEKLVRLLPYTRENCSRKFHEELIYAIDKELGCAPRMGPKGLHKCMITGALFLARHGNGRNTAVSSAVSDSKERLWPWRVP